MLLNAARIRISPEAMAKLLGLPEGVNILRVDHTGLVIEVLAVGDAMPKVEGEPVLIDSTELDPLVP